MLVSNIMLISIRNYSNIPPHQSQVHLEHVLGMTLTSRSALAVDAQTGVVAFPAGSVLVLLDGIKYK